VERERERERAPSPSPVRRDERSRYGDYYDDDESIDVHVRRVLNRDREARDYPPDASGFDDAASSTVYSFTPSRMSRAASTQPSRYTDDELPETDDHDAGSGGVNVRKEPDRALRLSHIIQSQYNGDHTLGGSHGVKLTAVLSSGLKSQPLYRWL
jgi:hypothetical protein